MGQDKNYVDGMRFTRYSLRFMKALQAQYQESVKDYHFTPSEIHVLLMLANHPEYSKEKDIVDFLNQSKGLISRSVSSLIQKGYIVSEIDIKDKRSNHLYLTPLSKEVIDRLHVIQYREFDKLFDGISKEEREVFGKVMLQLIDNIHRIL